MPEVIQSKVILITGASSGIGESTVKTLARQGHIILMGARRIEKLKALADELSSEGLKVNYRQLDVTQKYSVQQFADFAAQQYGRIDVMINNAGIMPLSPMSSLKVEEWDAMIDVNIRGVLHGVAAVLPLMQRQGNG